MRIAGTLFTKQWIDDCIIHNRKNEKA
jgi:hypothetical protein